MASSAQHIRWRGEQARVGAWRGDRRVAYLAPVSSLAPSPGFVRECLSVLARRGFNSVVTAAIPASQASGFIAAGFETNQRLHLLSHDLEGIDRSDSTRRTRRARRADRAPVLAVDKAAFPAFWHFDDVGLGEALRATPWRRFRVIGDAPQGYAITGRSAGQGYVQRVAVDPGHQGKGIGKALTLDGLLWLKRRGVAQALVNTQEDNTVALALYEGLGFRRLPAGLEVLEVML